MTKKENLEMVVKRAERKVRDNRGRLEDTLAWFVSQVEEISEAWNYQTKSTNHLAEDLQVILSNSRLKDFAKDLAVYKESLEQLDEISYLLQQVKD